MTEPNGKREPFSCMAQCLPLDFSKIAVGIPARDEAAHIGACLEALNQQFGAVPSDIVVLVNNSSDTTADIARSFRVREETKVHVVERTLPPGQANAGYARRLAMNMAARRAGPRGILLTTDADGAVDPEWLNGNLSAIRAGADAVAGWVELEPTDWSRIPIALHEADAQECAYDTACDEIAALLDPDDADPLPRHTQHSGASIAVTAPIFRAAGGIPDVSSGEDRAFFAALRRIGARVRHSPECRVVVSGRTEGRAIGGMAETIRRRMIEPDRYLDDRLEPAHDCAQRALLRARLRICIGSPALMQGYLNDVGLTRLDVSRACFSTVWDFIEARSPVLRRRRVSVTELPVEMARAEALRTMLRAGQPGAISCGSQSALAATSSSSLTAL